MKRFLNIRFILFLFCVFANQNLNCQVLPKNQAPLFLTIDELNGWIGSPENKSTIGLAKRKYVLDNQIFTNRSFSIKAMWCPDGMDNLANYINSASQFNLYNFTYWQYIDSFIWFSNSADGVFIPSKAWVEAAHRNGVKMYGCIFFSNGIELMKMVTNPDVCVSKLIAIAEYYGFDGWFLNQEAITDSDIASKTLNFLSSFQEKKTTSLDLVWYDSMILDGTLTYQNQLNSRNMPFFQNTSQNKRVSDALFTNYFWKSVQTQTSSNWHAINAARSPFDVYTGCDNWDGRDFQNIFGMPKFMDYLFDNENPATPLTSVAFFSPNYPFQDGFNKDDSKYKLFYDNTAQFFNGADLNAATTESGWKGVGYYLPVRTVISSLPFETSFNVGQGKIWAVDGKILPQNWSSISSQDILPSWQWAVSGNWVVKPQYDFDDAYNGGSSVKINGSSSSNPALVELYSTQLPITGTSKFALTFKSSIGPGPSLVLSFDNSSSNRVFLSSDNVSNTDWNTVTFYLGAYAGKVLSRIGVLVSVATLNIGKIKIYDMTSPGSDYYRIKSRFNSQYLYHDGNSDKAMYGITPNDQSFDWKLETYAGYTRIKNRKTNAYLNIDLNASNNYVQCVRTPVGCEGWYSNLWTILPVDATFSTIENRWIINRYIHVEDGLGYAQQNPKTNSHLVDNQWAFEPVP
ncbi:MAG: RICIN domain-containing protein [Prolixibacteraceae bacterium]|nr:RICIN domain-containing protein [Prolixibacteraceae bacterium]